MTKIHQSKTRVKSQMLDNALKLSKLGPVFPLKIQGKTPITKNGFKDATTDEKMIRLWWSMNPDANIGLATGKHLIIIDLDSQDAEKILENDEHVYGKLPSTLEVKTGKGRHLYFTKPLSIPISNKKPPHWDKIDIRGDGGYVVAPPSIHPSGAKYEFSNDLKPQPLPDTWIAYLSGIQSKPQPTPTTTGGKVKEGRRNDFLAKKAFHLKKEGLEGELLFEAVNKINLRDCDPPLDKAEIKKICNGTAKIEPDPVITPKREKSKFQKINACIDAAGWEFFLNQDDEPYAYVSVNSHYENIPLGSSRFKSLLRQKISEIFDEGCSNDAIDQVSGVIRGRLLHRPIRRNLYQRVARIGDKILIDSGRPDWMVYEISANGWRLTEIEVNPFTREGRFSPYTCDKSTTRAEWDDVFSVLGVYDPQHQGILKIWLGTALIPDIPRPGLVINGPPGSGKTTVTSFLRQVVDPCECPVERFPLNDIRSLELKLFKNFIPTFDNLNYIDQESSDILCQVVTGSLFDQRKLFTDSETVSRYMKKPWMLTGVSVPGTASDFLSRVFILELGIIPQDRRQDETAIKNQLNDLIPGLQARVFDCLAAGLRHLNEIRESGFQRLADAHRFSLAMILQLEMTDTQIDSVWAMNKANQDAEAAGGDILMELIPEFIEKNGGYWEGTAAQLHQEMFAHFTPERQSYRSQWPKKANKLSRRLNLLLENLLSAGITIEKDRLNRARILRISDDTVTIGDDKEKSIVTGNIATSLTNDDSDDRFGKVLFLNKPTIGVSI